MSKLIYIILLVLSFHCHLAAGEKDKKKDKESNDPDPKLPSRITYNFGGGGFGHNLMAYMRAKWLSHANKIPLLYKPFAYANQLTLHTTEKRFNEYNKEFDKTKVIGHEHDLDYMDPSSTLYVVPYFAECVHENDHRSDPLYFEVNWQDAEFKKILKKLVSPLKSIDYLKLSKNRINIAVHVRKGHGDETEEIKTQLPLKFPPDNYYVKQIKRLHKSFQGRLMYVHVFTDHRNPGEIVRAFQKALKLPNIQYGSHNPGNHAKTHVLDDFFNMIKFDCLIRPESNFSIAAEALGDYLVTIKPAHHTWDPKKQKNVIDAVNVKVR